MAAGRFCFRKCKLTENLVLRSCKVQKNRAFCTKGNLAIYLPWKQHDTDIFLKDRLLHRLVGMFLFRRLLKHAKISFDLKEFATGVREAVKVVSICICNKDSDGFLQSLLGSVLYRQFKVGFEQLQQEQKDLYLAVAAIRNLQITGARFLLGSADPGDEHIIHTVGQKIIFSKSEIEEFEEENNGGGMMDAFKYGKKFGEGAIAKSVRFQFDVKFETKESLLIDAEEDIKIRCNDESFDICYHKWTFESPVSATPNDDLSLEWTIVDMDDYVKKKFEVEEEEEEEEK